ncbi:MAG: molybdopterin-dependent oxidoreductase [Phycisphaerae bacterium]|jgi:predicted molibdopterin-dependent oxidoreductase YjgC
MIKLQIDSRELSVKSGTTVLDAARSVGISIPTLCNLEGLSPFGACRMCIVEIEGMRGFPVSCSTEVQSGMVVRTKTKKLIALRNDILQLILSEHPSACLICSEREECQTNRHTIRKVGVTTGCGYCPNDAQCELQDAVEHVKLTDIHYPMRYRGLDVEHDDPFYDRDYNTCILCGRCVRVCQDVRGTGTLAFKYRGPKALVGPAFGRSHIDSGCEFCGACVLVCPTGTLTDKASKWDGTPDGFETSTCPFCALGCQLELGHKDGQLSRVYPSLDPEINDGQLCLRGRYCLPETTHHHTRARKPGLRRGKYFREVTWDEALDEVAGKLVDVKNNDFMMVVSPDLTNESLYTAQKFVREGLGKGSIDSTVRDLLPGGLGLWSKLFSLPISLRSVGEADTIIAVGLDSRFYFSVIGVEIRRAIRNGGALVAIDPRDSNLARWTDNWLRAAPGKEGAVLAALTNGAPNKKADLTNTARKTGIEVAALEAAATAVSAAKRLAVVVSPTTFEYYSNDGLIDALLKLARRKNVNVVPLYNGANTRGAFELGALAGILPGVAKDRAKSASLDDLRGGKAKPKVLFLVGDTPFFTRPDCEYVIAQGTYHPPFDVDAFLPAASFAEAEGTLTNIEGRVQKLVKIEDLPEGPVTGFARPDWLIFRQLAERLKLAGFNYKGADAVLREIGRTVPGFPGKPNRKPRQLTPKAKLPVERRPARAVGTGSFLLVAEPAGFAHRGVDLASKVEGLAELKLEEGFRLHPDDLRKLRVEPGEPLTVANGKFSVTGPARPDEACPKSAVYYHRPFALGGIEHRADLEPLYRFGISPVKVKIRAATPARKPRQKKATSRKLEPAGT